MLFAIILGIGGYMSVGALLSDTIIDFALDSAGFYARFNI